MPRNALLMVAACAGLAFSGVVTVVSPNGAGVYSAGEQIEIQWTADAGVNIAFQLPSDLKVSLNIYDIRGRQAAALIDKDMLRGQHVSLWDGRACSGSRAAAGAYVVVLRAGGSVLKEKLLLVK